MSFREELEQQYKQILRGFLKNPTEEALYQAQNFSKKAIEQGISPEEIINIHRNGLMDDISLNEGDTIQTFELLLEVMMGYGLRFREYQSLRFKQEELKTEMEIAANVQQTLLDTDIPQIDCLDIGAISVPAKHMNGDYFHFVHDDNNCVSIAIADVIGKGIPAALCMSMIKYAMDSLPEHRPDPRYVLENLNRVVEQNVDPSMFVTMFYGMYNPVSHTFTYSSAGHEPGIYYHANSDSFEEIEARGLMLGVDRHTKYRQYVKYIQPNDMIILMSDGVTECRTDDGFIEREALLKSMRKYIHSNAQEMVNQIYKELEKLQDFELRDDFTLIVLKRKV
ncbi:phosphoserine phosphatase RsbU [Bacillus carboniphilus]|uniref:Phosphoserine phosphatase RsbU n=1 Tax=Bacillus carboniphilus TaxID=86663 RepID=A0ABP3FQU3_9BACI